MCTVTYLPNAAGFILTHNRDEAPARSPQNISRAPSTGDLLLFPRDTRVGGAWIVASRSGDTACLLNGAFIKHRHEPPYRRSRGLMLLDYFDYPPTARNNFFENYSFDGIEPFTFLLFQKNRALQFRWDGHQKHLLPLPPDAPHFWCSATLYPPEMQDKREQVFRSWLDQNPNPQPAGLLRLHRQGSVGDPENDFVMNRGGRVCTVSITQVLRTPDSTVLRYHDLLEGTRVARRIKTGG
jgi:Transport and Golgi organisation 2